MHLFDAEKRLSWIGWGLHGLGLSIALVGVVLGRFVLLDPIDRKAAECAERVHYLQSRLSEEDHVRAEHQRLSAEVDRARRETAALKERIPDDPCEAEFLAELARLAGDVGLQIRNYQPGAATARTSYSTLTVDLSGQGTYRSICALLDGLAHLPRHCTVRKLEIKADKRTATCAVELSVELYFDVRGNAQETHDPQEAGDHRGGYSARAISAPGRAQIVVQASRLQTALDADGLPASEFCSRDGCTTRQGSPAPS